jgi:hypothetical protein
MLVRIGEDILDLIFRLALDASLLLVGSTESSLGTGLRLRGRLCLLGLQAVLVIAAVGAADCLGATLTLGRNGWSVIVALGLSLTLGWSLLGGGSSSSGGCFSALLDGVLQSAPTLRDGAWGRTARLSNADPVMLL